MMVRRQQVVDVRRWRDPKKYLWLLGASVPCLVPISWAAVILNDFRWLWWLGLILAFMVIPVLDQVIPADAGNPPDGAYIELERDRLYRCATYLYLPNQYFSLGFACWLWSGGGWLSMTFGDKVGLMTTVGIVGGVGINAAHELGHKRQLVERRLSKIALAQTCYGHFFVEHNRGHHSRVATPADPASARLGESLYRFIPRSLFGGLRSSWHMEARRLARSGLSPWTFRNHILNAWLLSAAMFAVLALWFGTNVLPWLAGQAIIGIFLLEIVNYIEHYGLQRKLMASGRYEKVSPCHSWNSNAVVTNIFLFHLQRHSDHHANPQRRYQTLRSFDEAPELPGGYGTMVVLALFPLLWRRVMDPRVFAHYQDQIRLTAIAPRDRQPLLDKYGPGDEY